MDDAQLIRKYAEGETVETLAQHTGLSRESVRAALSRASSVERREVVIARASRGDRLAVVAEDLRLSYERVRQLARPVRSQRDRALEVRRDEIERRLREGHSPDTIASALHISERTARGVARQIREPAARYLSKERRHDLVRKAQNGRTYADIAREEGLSLSCVRSICSRVLGRRQKPPFDRDRALELYRAGWQDIAIARALGYSATAIQQWRERYGLPRVSRRSAKRHEVP